MRARSLVPLAALLAGCALDPLSSGGCPTPEPCFPGLSAEVTVKRDADGIPHVYAANDLDLFYASGYLQAVDRLFQMEITRRRALGRRAEILGAGAYGDDRIVRLLDIPRLGAENVEKLRAEAPEHHALLLAWIAGVNARIEEVRSGAVPLPPGFSDFGFEPEPWEPRDPFAIGKLILFGNANQLEFDVLATAIAELFPDLFGTVPFFAPIRDAFTMAPSEIPGSPQPFELPPPPPAPAKPAPADLRDRLRAFQAQLRELRPGASNNWAVRPEHTDTGRSLIAGDPHQGLRSPSLMWAHHLNSADAGGAFDVVGWTFVGTPGISLGHNRHLAWTATTTYPDIMDLFDVPVSSGQVTVGAQTVAVVKREETIAIAGAEPITFQVEDVPGQGVLLPNDLFPVDLVGAGHRVLFHWTGEEPTSEASAFLRYDTAQTLDDFDDAADAMELGCFNWIAATADGVTYRSSPRVPDRGDPSVHPPAFRMMDGTDPAALWDGTFLDGSRLPHGRGEARGFVYSANNDPWGFTKDGKLEGDPFYFGVYFDPGTRASRIEGTLADFVSKGQKIGVADMKALQEDTYSILAEEVLPYLSAAHDAIAGDPDLAEFAARPDLDLLVGALEAWDRRMDRDAGEPVVLHALVHFFARKAVADDLALFFEAVLDAEPLFPIKFSIFALRDQAPLLPAGKKNRLLLEALDEASAFLVERFGDVDPAGYAWKDVHFTSFGSIAGPTLEGGLLATNGGIGTVNVSSSSFFDGSGAVVPQFVSGSGSIYRMVASFDADGTPRAEFNLPRGNVGDPGSPHWDDLSDDWANGEYRLLRFRAEDVDAATAETLVIAPAP